ncbi:hypothetical protein L227DRAFT_510708 [Lentinus tigrinus ALCF2SS1-6]|uniref:Golgi apparatus membrane protein TVP38 n=1 Tax=Lentinus tigrinus ALCF2SS1-6 TaxID=1328759 RepID=A0A5C2RV03_9APHY|nr:hypothetical protein L227DRAFT_510708 [Lentinus tigrinus ALCF2SS1-6]
MSVSPNPSFDETYKKEERIGVDYRGVARTPSPTPSEAEALSGKTRSVNLKKYLNREYLKNPRNLFTLIVTLIIIGALIAFIALQQKILNALSPASDWLRETPGAWAIPIAIMIILSFPPLFGHELVALFCGDVWGVWIGFGIVSAGTILGELATYYVFRYCCRGRAEKAESKNLRYAFISEVIREGGLVMAIMVRYSAIPGHVTTAIFATAGMSVWTFLIAAFLALPKQLAAVYLGVAENSGAPADENGSAPTKTTKTIKIIVITLTILITIAAMRFVNSKIDGVKHRVIYARRKARQAKLGGAELGAGNSSSNWSSFPQDDAEAQPTTPFIPVAQRDSMDVVQPETGSPRAQPSALGRPAVPAAASRGYEQRYDDPYGGEGVDLAAMRSPALGAPCRTFSPGVGLGLPRRT